MFQEDIASETVRVEELAEEKIDSRIVREIAAIEIVISEVVTPKSRIILTKEKIVVCINTSVPTKKLIGWVAGLISFVWLALNFLDWVIPIIENYYMR